MDRLIKKYKPVVKEKFTRDGAGWLLLQQLIIAPMSLITTVLLAHILPIESYGYYKYILSMYSLISLFSLGGIYNITMMNIQRGEDGFFSLGFKYKKYLRWIPSAISLFIAIYYFYSNNNFLAIFFLLNIFSYLIVDTYDFYLVALQGKGDFKSNALFAVVYYFVSFFPPILTAYLSHNLYLIFITMYLSQGIFRFASFYYIKNKLSLNKVEAEENLDKDKIKEWKKESLSLSFNTALNSAGSSVSSVMVFNRLGAVDNAVYSLALTFADFVGGIVSATLSKTQLVLSKITKDNGYTKDSDILKIQYIKSLFKKYFWLSFFAMLGTMIILPFVYKILFAKYLFSYKYAVIYSLFLLSISMSPAYLFFLEKRNFKMINTIQIIVLILNLVSVFFASMYFGVWGAVIVAILMKYITNLVYTYLMYFNK